MLAELFPDTRVVSPREFLYFPEILENFPIVTGHVPLLFYQTEENERKLFTVLRDPVQRAISYYKYILKDAGHVAHDYVKRSGVTMKECLKIRAISYEMCNLQTRMLGLPEHTPPRLSHDTEEEFREYSEVMGRYVYTEVNDEMVRRVVTRLGPEIDFAFLEEPRSIAAMFERLFGASDITIPHLNTTEAIHYEIDEATLEAIKESVRFDQSLYDQARAKWLGSR
jgi:hypothetical protein